MGRVDCLDGLRGIAALWVLVGHTMMLTGLNLPVIAQPDLGVDLFIMLSGFLMVLQYQLRSEFEDWSRFRSWAAFWTRRFFRIAPLFYVALLAALLLGPEIYGDRVAIDTFLDRKLQQPERYLDASFTNVVLHLTFIFGLLPEYAFRTPLPDWSLGLEMQFYAAFPFLVLLARKMGWLWTSLLAMAVSIVLLLLARRVGAHFPMPSFLPLKLHLFLCGMLLAANAQGVRHRLWLQLGAAVLLAAIPIGRDDVSHLIVRELLVLIFFALVHLQRVPGVGFASRLLGNRPFHWLGELSFGVYLWHLLVLNIVAAWAIAQWGHAISPAERFLIVFSMVVAISYPLALLTYKTVELPGQQLGKVVQKLITGKHASKSIAPDASARRS